MACPIALAIIVSASAAHAQSNPDIEVPEIILDERLVIDVESRDEIDLANIVQSATKGVTAVQEAPAIVTVITDAEMQDRQLTSLEQAIDTVPGWLRLGAIHAMFPYPLTRGQLQSAILLHDGVSLFDPYINVPTVSRVQPVETIKRIEVITGPGGVLWGANSLLGIINVITKDAADVDGVEASATVGGGNGDRGMMRAYVMAGAPELLGGRLRAFAHASFDTYVGPGYEMPSSTYSQPTPQPNSPNTYGPLTTADPLRSYLFNLSGKLSYGNFQLRLQAPFVQRHAPLGFQAALTRSDRPEYTQRGEDGALLCPEAPVADGTDACLDRGRRNRDAQLNFFDRYAVLEHRARLADGRVGVQTRAYAAQFVRHFDPIILIEPSALLEGGLVIGLPFVSYRAGASFDGDVEMTSGLRTLYGVEAFHEWVPISTGRSRQGTGVASEIVAPYDLTKLPLPCPRDFVGDEIVPLAGCPLTATFPANRTVLAAYVNPQWRPGRRIILDAGARAQVAPASLGRQSYDVTPTFNAALVYGFLGDWHAKLGVTQGFRPPVFNNLASNGDSVQIDGDDDLRVETSTAVQGEINARLFRGDRRVRELGFRADYSYTYVQNLIQIVSGSYENTADRGVHSAELLAKLYVHGGHRLELGYTWLKVLTEDVGVHRSMPENWFNLGGVINLLPGRVSGTFTLRVIGAMEDPNRLVEHRGLVYDAMGRSVSRETGTEATVNVGTSELVMDRLPPVADLSVGLTWTPLPSLAVRAWVQNAFNGRFYQPDGFFSYEPRLEYLPNPAEDVRAYVSATYRH